MTKFHVFFVLFFYLWGSCTTSKWNCAERIFCFVLTAVKLVEAICCGYVLPVQAGSNLFKPVQLVQIGSNLPFVSKEGLFVSFSYHGHGKRPFCSKVYFV